MHVTLDLNELVSQIQRSTKEQTKALVEYNKLLKEVEELRNKVMDYEVEELKRQYDKDRELDEMAQHYESLDNNIKKVING